MDVGPLRFVNLSGAGADHQHVGARHDRRQMTFELFFAGGDFLRCIKQEGRVASHHFFGGIPKQLFGPGVKHGDHPI